MYKSEDDDTSVLRQDKQIRIGIGNIKIIIAKDSLEECNPKWRYGNVMPWPKWKEDMMRYTSVKRSR